MKVNGKYDWSIIQKDYDTGLSYNDLIKKYSAYRLSMKTLQYAKRRGDLKIRTKSEAQILTRKNNPRIVSDVTKEKISKARLKFLNENPDKVPYKLNHSSVMSYPEKRFQDALLKNGISGWTYNYQFGLYSFDFAFIKEKIDVEIDGGTHLLEKVIEIDKRRDENSRKNGWIVKRFTAKEIKHDINKCIEELKILLS